MIQSFSVRTYNFLLRDKVDMDSVEAVLAYADRIRDKKVRLAGRKTAVELYRAAGLGVYPILKRMNYEMSINWVKWHCEYLDRYTFHYARQTRRPLRRPSHFALKLVATNSRGIIQTCSKFRRVKNIQTLTV